MTVKEGAPKDFQTLRTAIAQRADQLPKRLMQVAGYALENPDEIAFGTVASIAASADVQPSALVRFSHALGYQGFSDLQDVFRSRLRDRVLNYDERLAQMRDHGIATSKSGLVLDGFLEASERSIAKFREKVDHEAIDRAVAILAAADTIYLIGLRRSFPITSYMSYAMGKLGVRNILVDAVAGMGAEQASFISAQGRRARHQLRALCQRDGRADRQRQGARRQDRHDHRFRLLADRFARRRAGRGQRGEFRGFPLDGDDYGDRHDTVGGGRRETRARAKSPAVAAANCRRRAPAGRSR